MPKDLAPAIGAPNLEEAAQPAFSRTYRAYLLVLLTLIYLVNCVDRQIVAVVLQPMKRELNLSDSALGWLTGMGFALTFSLVGVPLAQLADRTRRKPIIAGALLAFSGFTALCALVGNYWQLALARLGVSIGEAGTNPQSQSLIADLFPLTWRPMVMAIYSTGANLGLVVALIVGGLITSTFGWRAAFLAPGAFGVLVWLLLVTTMREPLRPSRSVAGTLPASLSQGARELLRSKPLLHVTAALTLNTFAGYGGIMWMPAFFIRAHDLSPARAGVLLAMIAGGGGLFGTLVGGALSSRLARRDIRWSLWIVAAVQACAAPLVAAAYSVHSLPLALLFIAGPAMANTFSVGPALAHVQGLAPIAMRATTAALVGLVSSIVGAGLGPTAIGVSSDLFARLGSHNSLGVALACSAVIWLWAAFHYARAGALLTQSAD
jgi:predicted MFS family arabinose efflux permease